MTDYKKRIETILLAYDDPTNNGAGHHNVVYSRKAIEALLHQVEADSYANALYDVGYGFAPIKEIDSVEEKLAAFTYREES